MFSSSSKRSVLRDQTRLAVLLFALSLSAVSARADYGKSDYFELPLEQVLNLNVTVAGMSNATIRNAPGIVTVLTREEIENSGARDLMDLLTLVPGLHLFFDSQGVVTVGIRGFGDRVLLLWDGHEVNDLLYVTLQMGHHYPVEEIERVEVIRGPGSVLYGGAAALGVINVVTRRAEDIDGAIISASGAATKDTVTSYNGDIMVGKQYGDLRVKASLFKGKGKRGEGTYTDSNGDSYLLQNYSALNPQIYTLDVSNGALDIRFMGDNYHTRQRDEFGENLPDDAILNFDRYAFYSGYSWNPNTAVTITPSFRYAYQTPWKAHLLPGEENFEFNQMAQRYTADLLGRYEPNEYFTYLAGVRYFTERAEDRLENSFPGSRNTVQLSNVAVFAEVQAKTEWANVVMGARYDHPDKFDGALVPRFSVTRVFDKLHAKFLASSSYRSPSIQNYSLNAVSRETDSSIARIKPERTTVYEVEAGYSITDSLNWTINLFDLNGRDAINYRYDAETDTESYVTSPNGARTHGAESTIRWQGGWGYMDLNYSYYKSTRHLDDDSVPGHPDYYYTFPQHKIAARASVKLTSELRLNPSAVINDRRYANLTLEEETLEEVSPETILNLHLAYHPDWSKDWRFNIGVNNLLNDEVQIVAPADTGHSSIPTFGREYVTRASYHF